MVFSFEEMLRSGGRDSSRAGLQARSEILAEAKRGLKTALLGAPNHLDAQIRPQRFGNDDAAVGLLVIFDDRDPGASHRQAAAVQRVDVFRFLSGSPANGRAPGLIRFEIRARGN